MLLQSECFSEFLFLMIQLEIFDIVRMFFFSSYPFFQSDIVAMAGMLASHRFFMEKMFVQQLAMRDREIDTPIMLLTIAC